MSFMISQPTEIDCESTLKNRLRKITFHPSQFNSTQLKKWNNENEQRQNLFLKNICKKFAIHEQEIIRQKSSEQITHQLKDLKHRLRHTLEKQNIEKIMSEKQTKHQHYLDKVLREQTEMVDIGKKYSKKINLKLSLFNQAHQIGDQKYNYQQWYDHHRNGIVNSPIYHEIRHLLNAKDKNESKKPIKSTNILRNTLDEQILTYNQSSYVKKKRNYNGRSDNRLKVKQ